MLSNDYCRLKTKMDLFFLTIDFFIDNIFLAFHSLTVMQMAHVFIDNTRRFQENTIKSLLSKGAGRLSPKRNPIQQSCNGQVRWNGQYISNRDHLLFHL